MKTKIFIVISYMSCNFKNNITFRKTSSKNLKFSLTRLLLVKFKMTTEEIWFNCCKICMECNYRLEEKFKFIKRLFEP